MPNSDQILSAYHDLAHRYRRTLILYSLLSLVISGGLTCLFHLANRPFSQLAMVFFPYGLALLLSSALLLLLFSCAIIVLDMFFQWKTSTLMLRDESDRQEVQLSKELVWRVLRGSYRALLIPILAFIALYIVWYIYDWLCTSSVVEMMAPVLAVMIFIASAILFPRLNRSQAFVTSAILAGRDPAQSYQISKTFVRQHRTEVRAQFTRAFLRIPWLLLKSGIAVVLCVFFIPIVISGYYPGNGYEANIALLYFVYGVPPLPSISFIVLSSILCASMIALPYRSILRWLCYREFTSVEDDNEKC